MGVLNNTNSIRCDAVVLLAPRAYWSGRTAKRSGGLRGVVRATTVSPRRTKALEHLDKGDFSVRKNASTSNRARRSQDELNTLWCSALRVSIPRDRRLLHGHHTLRGARTRAALQNEVYKGR